MGFAHLRVHKTRGRPLKAIFQDIVHRLPVIAGALHRYMAQVPLVQPVVQLQQFRCRGPKGLRLPLDSVFIRYPHPRGYHCLLVHIQPRHSLVDDLHPSPLQQIRLDRCPHGRILLHVLEATIGGAQGHPWQTYNQALGTKYVSPSDQPSPTSIPRPAPWCRRIAYADHFRPWWCPKGHVDSSLRGLC